MPVNPKFLSARAAERRHRLYVHARSLAWIAIANSRGVFAHTPLVALTRRHCIEMELAGNAFFSGRVPTAGDAHLLLWRLHPLYRAPRLGLDRLLHRPPFGHRLLRAWRAFGSWRVARAYWLLSCWVQRGDLPRLTIAIRAFLDAAEQDAVGDESQPTRDGKIIPKRRSPIAPERCLIDNLVDYTVRRYHLTPDEVLDMPVALSNQLYREAIFAADPDEAFTRIFAPSDTLLSP